MAMLSAKAIEILRAAVAGTDPTPVGQGGGGFNAQAASQPFVDPGHTGSGAEYETAVMELLQAGYLEQEGPKRYRVTPAGRKVASRSQVSG